MPVAKVVLTRGPKTHTYKNRKFVRGEPQTVTTQHEIDYYRTTYGFSVTEAIIGSRKTKTKLNERPKKKVYTQDELDGLKKKKLISIAEKYGAPLTGNEKKSELVEAILAVAG